MEETLTMRPSPRSTMPRATRRVTRKVPRMLMSNTRSHSAGVTSRNSVGELTPAMLASPTMGGNRDSTCVIVGDVRGEAHRGGAPPVRDLLGRDGRRLEVEIEDGHRPPVPGEPVRGGAADPARRGRAG